MATQGQKMEAARGHQAPPCRLHERSRVEALAGLLTLYLPMLGSQKMEMRRFRGDQAVAALLLARASDPSLKFQRL